jgi:PhnB protein
MSIDVTTHLNFRGEARAALEHYAAVFGGELVAITYADAHNVSDPAEADQIMWGQVTAPNGFRVMAFDVPSGTPHAAGENAFFVSVRGTAADEITSLWEGLAAGATIVQPLAPAQWAPLYGMLRDRFGVTWVLDVAVEYAAS